MANTIQEYAVERDIKYLMHFTRTSNLGSILQRGLLLRETLNFDSTNHFNDQYRYDGTTAVCLSIGFPNYKMFWGIRQDNKDVDWIILVINKKVLWELSCAFCVENAASAAVTVIPLEQRKNLVALQAMYADCGDKTRTVLSIPNQYPTNPQAEVLMLEGVPKDYIRGVFVLNTAKQHELQVQYPGLDVKVNAGYFRYRQDYAHWK